MPAGAGWQVTQRQPWCGWVASHQYRVPPKHGLHGVPGGMGSGSAHPTYCISGPIPQAFLQRSTSRAVARTLANCLTGSFAFGRPRACVLTAITDLSPSVALGRNETGGAPRKWGGTCFVTRGGTAFSAPLFSTISPFIQLSLFPLFVLFFFFFRALKPFFFRNSVYGGTPRNNRNTLYTCVTPVTVLRVTNPPFKTCYVPCYACYALITPHQPATPHHLELARLFPP